MSRVLTCVLVVTSIGATAGAAQAGTARDSSQETATSQAVIAAAGRTQGSTVTRTAQGLNVSAASGTIQIPLKVTGAITSGNVQIGLPDLGGADATAAEDGTVVYRNDGAAAETAVQATAQGVRALVVAKNASAPQQYTFPVTLPTGGRLVSSAQLFGAKNDTGEIFALDRAGSTLGVFAKAWAKDAKGAALPTQYRIEGSSIVQTVKLADATAFPAVINFDFFKILRCVAAVGLLVASAAPGGAILRFVRRIGDVRKAVTIFRRALNVAGAVAKRRAVFNLLKSVGGAITGIDKIVDACG